MGKFIIPKAYPALYNDVVLYIQGQMSDGYMENVASDIAYNYTPASSFEEADIAADYLSTHYDSVLDNYIMEYKDDLIEAYHEEYPDDEDEPDEEALAEFVTEDDLLECVMQDPGLYDSAEMAGIIIDDIEDFHRDIYSAPIEVGDKLRFISEYSPNYEYLRDYIEILEVLPEETIDYADDLNDIYGKDTVLATMKKIVTEIVGELISKYYA